MDEEKQEDEAPPRIEPRDIVWDRESPDAYDLQIPAVLAVTLETIQFSKRKEHVEPGSGDKAEDKAQRELRNQQKQKNRTFQMLKKNMPTVKRLIEPLFWYTHLNFFFPECKEEIDELNNELSHLWHEFLYPLRTNLKRDQGAVDKLVLCIPYFFTQAIQDIFIRLLRGNPVTMESCFRMRLCSMMVNLFSGVKPIDSLLKSRLAFYFHFPPQADIIDQYTPNDDDKFTNVTLPHEDLQTLIVFPRRARAVGSQWHVAAVSPFVGTMINRDTLPVTRDATVTVQMPKNGVDDWTTNLPPLLPRLPKPQDMTATNYNPQGETRSLMYRSRRPNIIPDYEVEKEEFLMMEEERASRKKSGKKFRANCIAHAKNCAPEVLTKFVNDLRKLQLERKRGETPVFEDEKDQSGFSLSRRIIAPSLRTQIPRASTSVRKVPKIQQEESFKGLKYIEYEQEDIILHTHVKDLSPGPQKLIPEQ